MLKGTWCRWHLGGERPVPTGGKGSLLFRKSGSIDGILSNPYLSVQEQQFWCALQGERCLPFPRSITLHVSHGWCETHTCRQSLFPRVMKRSSQAARLITADNSEWKSAEQAASHHSVISGMCPQKVLKKHCRSPAPRATCLTFPLRFIEVILLHRSCVGHCSHLLCTATGCWANELTFSTYFCLKGWPQRFLSNCTVFEEAPGKASLALISPCVIFESSRR